MKADLIKKLQSVGFNLKEARLYLAALELGEATAADIAKRAGILRTTSYNILPQMVRDGILDTTEKSGTKYFLVSDVQIQLKKKERELTLLKSLTEELKEVHSVIPRKPMVSIYEGISGLERIYQDAVDSTERGGEIIGFVGTKSFQENIPAPIIQEFIDKRMQRKVSARAILDKTSFSEKMLKNNQNQKREFKFADSSLFDFQGEMMIYNGKVAMISYTEGFLGTIIDSKEIYDMHKGIFEELWKRI